MGKKAAGGYYAVGIGRKIGIFSTWDECQAQVTGFPNAKYKKFATENDAKQFISQYQAQIKQPINSIPVLTGQSSSISQLSSHVSYQSTSSNVPKAAVGTSNSEEKLHELILKSKRSSDNEGKGQTKFLASPLPNTNVKRMRTDSPQIKGMETANGDKVFLPFMVDDDGFVNVFTDGACHDNGRENPRAGVGVYFGDDHPLNVSEPVNGPPTNNTAEIQAARIAIELAVKAEFPKLRVNTDSAFLIQCMTQWIRNWKKNGWKLASGGDVKNRIELEKLDKAQRGIIVEWVKVPAHSGVHENEMADKLANEGAKRY